MPYSIRKLSGQNLYRVRLKDTGQILSYATTLENARKQIAYLHMRDAQKERGGALQPSPLQIVSIEKSRRKGKKLCAVLSDDRRIDFGSDVSTTFAEGASQQKKDSYFKRHLANAVERNKIQNLKMSPALLSAYVLWLTPDMETNVKILNERLRAQKG